MVNVRLGRLGLFTDVQEQVWADGPPQEHAYVGAKMDWMDGTRETRSREM